MDYNKALEWRAGPGICRCCLSEGCYKDISTEYFWMGEKEIYGAMLLECFDITISYQEGKANGSSRLICEVCITRLRDAANFKKQVANSEKNFVKHIAARQACSSVKPFNHFQLKELHEDVKDEQDDSDYGLEDLFDASNSDNDTGETVTKVEPIDSGFDMNTEATVKKVVAIKRPLVMKEEEVPPKKVKQSAKLPAPRAKGPELDPPPGNREVKLVKVSKSIILARNKDKAATMLNAIKLIENSNMCPFQRNTSHYKCFYCDDNFLDMNLLRSHSVDLHTAAEVKERIYRACLYTLCKVDVTALQCNVCNEPQKSIDSLKTHLRQTHGHSIDLDMEDLLVPFSLLGSDFDCQLCAQKFTAFHSLNIHMNKHFKNHICETCGAAFRSFKNWQKHKLSHEVRALKCLYCDEVFPNSNKKACHEISVHKKSAKNKCPYCTETFNGHYQKYRHIVSVHGIKLPELKCTSCDKTFHFRHALNTHVRCIHLKERNHACEICGKSFFLKTRLRKHMETHTGEKKFDCTVCSKSYARKRTLFDHMKIHNNERNFICVYCSAAFVQKCSLQYHLKKHHPTAPLDNSLGI